MKRRDLRNHSCCPCLLSAAPALSSVATCRTDVSSARSRLRNLRFLLVVAVFHIGIISAAASNFRVVPSPNPSRTSNTLNAAAAISDDDVWVVGSIVPGSGGTQTMAEHWDGTSWHVVPGPKFNCASEYAVNTLLGISATTTNDVWAVGSQANCANGFSKTLVEHWNGTSWSVVPSPSPGAGDGTDFLSAVVALSADNAWAVGGTADNELGQVPLVEHWDGQSWKTVQTNAPRSEGSFSAVSATATDDVWAVGADNFNTYPSVTLIEHWNGTQWSRISSPNPAGEYQEVFLNGVAALAPENVVAVGWFWELPDGKLKTLVEQWDGMQWKIVPSPNAVTDYSAWNFLNAVTAISPNDIWAVGDFTDNRLGFQRHTLIEHWDGSRWAIVASPSPNKASILNGVTVLSTGKVWAVGASAPSGETKGNLIDPKTLVLSSSHQ